MQAAPALPPPDSELIAGLYTVDITAPLADAGRTAFAATDRSRRRSGLMAQPCAPDAPARPLPLSMLAASPIEGVMCPVAHGAARGPDGRMALFVIGPTPPGPALSSLPTRMWSEPDLLAILLRPVAGALDRLAARHLTHRAIRPDNLFLPANAGGVVLGGAWDAPPASRQSALHEPPYVAMCHPSSRGEGCIADDVYALGVVMVTLALGRAPLAGLGEPAIIARKLELGSYVALVGEARLPAGIADLARFMLADDPDQRPSPAMLADPASARARRIANRPPRRAQRPLALGPSPVWTQRGLAYAIASSPEPALRLLRDGTIDRWIRRALGDPATAIRLEEALRQGQSDPDDNGQADALLVLRVTTMLDPLAPLAWRGAILWPDGLGPLLAAADTPELEAALRDLIEAEAIMTFAALRPDRADLGEARLEAHRLRAQLRQRGWGGGIARLRHTLNPLLGCAAPILGGRLATTLRDLLLALNQVGLHGDRPPGGPIDAQIGAFLAARQDSQMEPQLLAMDNPAQPDRAAQAQLQELARLQGRLHLPPLPGLTDWLGDMLRPALARWRNQDRRAKALAQLALAQPGGDLAALQALTDDKPGALSDRQGADAARHAIRAIDAELARLEAASPTRLQQARRASQDLVLSLGFVVLAVLLLHAVLA